MRTNRILPVLAATLVAALCARPAFAGPVAYDNELLVSGGFFHAQDSDFSNINLELSWGRYLSHPAFELGLFQTVNYEIIDNADDVWSATTAPFIEWNILGISEENRVVPYIGGLGGVVWNDQDATGTVGPMAGLKFFVTDSTFIQTAYRYEWFFDSLDQAGNNSSDGNHIVTLGIGYVWGGSGERR